MMHAITGLCAFAQCALPLHVVVVANSHLHMCANEVGDYRDKGNLGGNDLAWMNNWMDQDVCM
jgi:hypothetical protein